MIHVSVRARRRMQFLEAGDECPGHRAGLQTCTICDVYVSAALRRGTAGSGWFLPELAVSESALIRAYRTQAPSHMRGRWSTVEQQSRHRASDSRSPPHQTFQQLVHTLNYHCLVEKDRIGQPLIRLIDRSIIPDDQIAHDFSASI